MAQGKSVKQKEMQGEKRDPNRDWTKTYDESDLKHVLKVSNAKSWNDAIKYLDQKGMNDNELTPGETISMKADLQKAAKAGGAKFSSDAAKAYKEIKGSGGSKSQSRSQKKR